MSERQNSHWYAQLQRQLQQWGEELGFQQVGLCSTDLTRSEARLHAWLDAGNHGEMGYMAHHGDKRSRPAELEPDTRTIISVRMDYLPDAAEPWSILENGELAYVSRYALGRDYHKMMRKRLKRLAERLADAVGPFGYRVFVDSAPVLEKPLAQQAGLGWQGKHTNLINRQAGSWFFLGEIYTDLPLPDEIKQSEQPVASHCGSCTACIDVCPTDAITAPYQLDARRCISYLTIEHPGPIPEELRPAIGNRIYGCDDCQLVCPWNRFASLGKEADFQPRHGLDGADLLALYAWDEQTFLNNSEGSAIRRLGYSRWRRNLAVALGNAPASSKIVESLQQSLSSADPLVAEHIEWAIQRQTNR